MDLHLNVTYVFYVDHTCLASQCKHVFAIFWHGACVICVYNASYWWWSRIIYVGIDVTDMIPTFRIYKLMSSDLQFAAFTPRTWFYVSWCSHFRFDSLRHSGTRFCTAHVAGFKNAHMTLIARSLVNWNMNNNSLACANTRRLRANDISE